MSNFQSLFFNIFSVSKDAVNAIKKPIPKPEKKKKAKKEKKKKEQPKDEL